MSSCSPLITHNCENPTSLNVKPLWYPEFEHDITGFLLKNSQGQSMLSTGLSLFRRRNGMVRNSSITHHHPNCAYLEVESVRAKESLLWKQALCWRESQTERDRERAMQGIFKSRNDTVVDRIFSLIGGQHTDRVQRDPCSIFTGHTWEKVNRHVQKG